MLKSIACPICEGKAEDIGLNTFAGKAVKCSSCGEFEITRSLLLESKWQMLDLNGRLAALERAKKEAVVGARPRITSYHIIM